MSAGHLDGICSVCQLMELYRVYDNNNSKKGLMHDKFYKNKLFLMTNFILTLAFFIHSSFKSLVYFKMFDVVQI